MIVPGLSRAFAVICSWSADHRVNKLQLGAASVDKSAVSGQVARGCCTGAAKVVAQKHARTNERKILELGVRVESIGPRPNREIIVYVTESTSDGREYCSFLSPQETRKVCIFFGKVWTGMSNNERRHLSADPLS